MRTINWGWMKYRWQTRRHNHQWQPGDRAGHQACRGIDGAGCGVWRWNPLMTRPRKVDRG